MNAVIEEKLSKPVLAGQPELRTMTVSQFIVKQLKEWGVRRIYGVIGDSTFYLLDELSAQEDIQYIACRHEGAAALMASAEAKLTGRLGVCLATSGPGIANLLNGLADAAADRAGVLALTGQVATDELGTGAKQEINQQLLIQAITEQSELLCHPDALPPLLQRLLVQAALHGKVAHLAIPKDMFPKKVKGNIVPYSAHLHQQVRTPCELWEEAAEKLDAALRPVVYVGRGADKAAHEVVRLAEKLDAPIITTLPARPLVPNDHPLYLGGLGQAGSEPSSVLLAESDRVLMLGATWWPEDYVPAQAPILQIDIAPAQIGAGHPLAQGIVADLASGVSELAERLGRQPDRTEWRERTAKLREAWKQRMEQEAALEGSPLPPQAVMSILSGQVSTDAILTVDTGDHTLWFNRIYQAREQQRVLISGRWRTLGFALPAAIAAQLCHPERQVVAIAGDGGSVQTLMEFQTAAELALPIVLIVMNNGAYAMERNRMQVEGLSLMGSAIRNPDFAGIAAACGGYGCRVEDRNGLRAALKEAMARKHPSLIEVVCDDMMVPHTSM
ncbi:thiamine pyrophosphate-binding protein [Paenibacillus sp. J2TS4]|uniref:thiamine pyrophosphate-binding protein n=1 Tax=Paenibacillus sp. J2TS4 TaxID=2807194 RepID=UPI001B225878|nr:thiamine pyrophosphate-binding protein [Paenibacillus sp. J2TS4]GIP33846.1 putative thiamine pyrophosphate-containing protein YdaP [Paenibacillus sp. J2TS4]